MSRVHDPEDLIDCVQQRGVYGSGRGVKIVQNGKCGKISLKMTKLCKKNDQNGIGVKF